MIEVSYCFALLLAFQRLDGRVMYPVIGVFVRKVPDLIFSNTQTLRILSAIWRNFSLFKGTVHLPPRFRKDRSLELKLFSARRRTTSMVFDTITAQAASNAIMAYHLSYNTRIVLRRSSRR